MEVVLWKDSYENSWKFHRCNINSQVTLCFDYFDFTLLHLILNIYSKHLKEAFVYSEFLCMNLNIKERKEQKTRSNLSKNDKLFIYSKNVNRQRSQQRQKQRDVLRDEHRQRRNKDVLTWLKMFSLLIISPLFSCWIDILSNLHFS